MIGTGGELWRLAAVEGAAEIGAGRLNAGDWMAAVLDRIVEADPLIRAFVQVKDRERLIARAHAQGRRIRAHGPLGPIDGAPVALKDSIDEAGEITTGCSRLLQNAPPAAEDADVVTRLNACGTIILGRQTMYELNYGGPSFDLPSPPARNPWDLSRIPGGSSSGSAAAVAAGCGPLAVGTDAGGSIRQPASFCGVIGLKGTVGKVSGRGVLPMSLTLGDAGPIARSVDDASALWDALSSETTFVRRSLSVSGLRVAVLDDFAAYARPDAAKGLERAVAALAAAGAVQASLASPPDPRLLDATGRVILLAEAFATHEADLKADPGRYGEIARRRFSLGALLSGADVIQAQRQRARLTQAMDACFADADILITPGEADIAPRFEAAGDSFPFTATPSLRIGFNVTGHPALVVPSAFGAHGMPVAVQLAAAKGREDILFAAARIIERTSGVRDAWPAFRPA
jgi:aspartyl-tRNA(Asn)/glutamyl-tRNA(Gln) amidotransferase subunit A